MMTILNCRTNRAPFFFIAGSMLGLALSCQVTEVVIDSIPRGEPVQIVAPRETKKGQHVGKTPVTLSVKNFMQENGTRIRVGSQQFVFQDFLFAVSPVGTPLNNIDVALRVRPVVNDDRLELYLNKLLITLDLLKTGSHAQALSLIEDIESVYINQHTLFIKARIYAGMKQHGLAIVSLQRAQRIDPQHQGVKKLLAQLAPPRMIAPGHSE